VSPTAQRNSGVAPTRALNQGEGYELEIVHTPTISSKFDDYVDIVAVHGLTERTDSKKAASTWLFVPPTRANIISIPGFLDPSRIEGTRPHILNHASEIISAPSLFRLFREKINYHHEAESSTTKSVNWLKDEGMLPKSFPQARIMQFGYPFSAADGSGPSLEDIASELLKRLIRERENSSSESRPIIFIGHSFGGIVISKALILAENKETYLDIATATIGLLFLGTPFRGSTTVVKYLRSKNTHAKSGTSPLTQTEQSTSPDNPSPEAAAPVNPPVDHGTPPLYTLLDLSAGNAKILDCLVKDVQKIITNRSIHVACFYETIDTNLFKEYSTVGSCY
jgi:hypothetical protein